MEIKITLNNREITADQGENLAKVLMRHGINISRPCGAKGTCGKCRVLIDGIPVPACRHILTKDITVDTLEEGEMLFEDDAHPASGDTGTDAVLDLGTTTLALALIDKNNQSIVKTIKKANPQRSFGADVISRIEYAQKNGVQAMTQAICLEVSEMLRELGVRGLDTLYVAGNTTMLHIFAGVDPSPMGTAPYTPSFLEIVERPAEDFMLSGVKTVCLLPSVSSFVGADIVAGICHVGLPPQKYRLLIDLGTNAEIALLSKDRVITTSAAAGPCFEGACISSGMSATDGAVYRYDGNAIKTVNGLPARGICATGLVDIIAFLLRRAKIDSYGNLDEEEFEIAPGVSLNQEDIRQYQLAKSAIYSAIITIMEKHNICFDDIEALYIAGGFSAQMDPKNAASTGLIPPMLADRCRSVGNSSLMGAIRAVFEEIDLTEIVDKAIYVDLSHNTSFADLFVKNMSFKR
ncbi:MAG: DUF4445 domain-containing protein [Clostridia bacterium]|nr:DUF4445 domain-containing protein [Clostridia bacterium]